MARISSALRSRFGLNAGDRVALAMKNCLEFYEVLFACWHAGLTAVPMNAKLHPKEFAYILENSGTKLCFVSPDLAVLLRAQPQSVKHLVRKQGKDKPRQASGDSRHTDR